MTFNFQCSPILHLKKDVSPTTKLFWLVVRLYSSALQGILQFVYSFSSHYPLQTLHSISLLPENNTFSNLHVMLSLWRYFKCYMEENTHLTSEFFNLLCSLLIEKNFVFAIIPWVWYGEKWDISRTFGLNLIWRDRILPVMMMMKEIDLNVMGEGSNLHRQFKWGVGGS